MAFHCLMTLIFVETASINSHYTNYNGSEEPVLRICFIRSVSFTGLKLDLSPILSGVVSLGYFPES